MKRVCCGLGSTLLLSGAALLSPGVVGAAGVSQAREVPPPPGDRGELLYELPGSSAGPDKRSGGAPASAVVPGRRAVPLVPTPAPVPLATASRPGAAAPSRAPQKPVVLPAATSDARPRRDRGANDTQPPDPKKGSTQAAATKPSVAPAPARRLRQAEATAPASRGSRREADEPARPSRMSKTPPKMPAKASIQKADQAADKAIAKADTRVGAARSRSSSATHREGRSREPALRTGPKGRAQQKVTAEPGTPQSLRQAGRGAPPSSTRTARVNDAPSRKVVGGKPKAVSRAPQSEGRDGGRDATRSADTPRRVTRSAAPTALSQNPRERRVSRETPPRSAPKVAMKSAAKRAVKPTATQATTKTVTQKPAKPGAKPNPNPKKAVRTSPR